MLVTLLRVGESIWIDGTRVEVYQIIDIGGRQKQVRVKISGDHAIIKFPNGKVVLPKFVENPVEDAHNLEGKGDEND